MQHCDNCGGFLKKRREEENRTVYTCSSCGRLQEEEK